MKTRKKITIGLGALLLIGVGAWALGFLGGIDREVAELDNQRKQVFSGEATDAQRQEFRDRVGQLTDEQRRQLFERSRPEMRERISERMREIFALPPEELRKEVNERVDNILAGREERADDPGRGGGRGGNRTEAEREARSKQRLDFVDPSTRAQFSEFRRMIDTELESRGQDPMSGRDFRSMMGRRGGGGGGGRGR